MSASKAVFMVIKPIRRMTSGLLEISIGRRTNFDFNSVSSLKNRVCPFGENVNAVVDAKRSLSLLYCLIVFEVSRLVDLLPILVVSVRRPDSAIDGLPTSLPKNDVGKQRKPLPRHSFGFIACFHLPPLAANVSMADRWKEEDGTWRWHGIL